MKFIQVALLAAGFAAAGSAMAAGTAVTGADGTQKATQLEYTASNPAKYVATDFNFNVSSNVALAVEESNSGIAVGAASFRGLPNVFTGSSEGGAVAVCGDAVSSGESIAAIGTVTAKVSVANIGGCTSNGTVN